jgi:uncharacterized membrane protein YhdT
VNEQAAVEAGWALWLAATVASFTVLEVIAYRTQRMPTLSRTLQRWMGVEPRNRWGTVSPFVFVAGGAWLSWHIGRALRPLP